MSPDLVITHISLRPVTQITAFLGTAKPLNNKAQGRAAHPGSKRHTGNQTPEGFHNARYVEPLQGSVARFVRRFPGFAARPRALMLKSFGLCLRCFTRLKSVRCMVKDVGKDKVARLRVPHSAAPNSPAFASVTSTACGGGRALGPGRGSGTTAARQSSMHPTWDKSASSFEGEQFLRLVVHRA